MFYYCEQDLSAGTHGRQTQAALAVLRFALEREYGMDSLPGIAVLDNGKPYFPERPDICFNYSHCRSGILVGIGRRSVGADAETVRVFKKSLAMRVCCPRELAAADAQPDPDLALTKLWTAKEAYLKFTGEGIRRDLRELDMADILADMQPRTIGARLRVWVRGRVCLCACVCAQEQEALCLRQITVNPDEIFL